MPVSTYILDIDDFTNVIDLNNNILTSRLKQYFGIEQDKSLRAVLCKDLYDAIIDDLAQGGESYLSAEYEALLPYIKDFLIFKTMVRYYANANIKSTPAGMRTHTDTISAEANAAQMRSLIEQAQSDAEFYHDELLNFLENNVTDYPLWQASRCNTCSKFTKATGSTRFGSNNSTKSAVKWT